MTELVQVNQVLDLASEQERLKAIISDVLKKATQKGASEAEASASISTGYSVTVRMGDVETLEHQRDKGLAVSVYFGKQKGTASTSDLSAEALETMVNKACDIARFTAQDPCAGLAEAEKMATHLPDLDLYHPWSLTPEQAIQDLIECETLARNQDARIINSDGASLSTHCGTSVYGNTHGFIGAQITSSHDVSLVLIGKQEESMERDYSFTVARVPSELHSFQWLADDAVHRTVSRLNPRKIPTQKAPVIFSSEIAKGLLNHFFSAIKGGSLYRKASFLLDHLHKQVFPSFVELIDDPYVLRGLGSSAFDSEGVQAQKRAIVSKGILEGYILGSYSARKLGMETTGNAGGLYNVFVKNTGQDKAALLKQMDTGLLVTEVMGQGVNLVTGDYSRGAAGFWVEHGEIQFPVSEITIAGNLKDIFMKIAAIGTDTELRSSIKTGSILVEEMMIAGS